MCRQHSFMPYGKDKVGSMPVMRYMIVNKIHTHLYVGRYGDEYRTLGIIQGRGILCLS